MEKASSIDWRIIYYILIVIFLVILNAVLIFVTQRTVRASNKKKVAIQVLLQDLDGFESGVLRGWDVGLRGYAITKTPNMLDPYDYAFIFGKELLQRMATAGASIGVDPADIQELERLFDAYAVHMRELKTLIDRGKEEEFRAKLEEDFGVAIWERYDIIRRKYQGQFLRDTQLGDENLTLLQNRIIITQTVSAFLAVFLAFLIYRKILSFAREKQAYIKRIEEANTAMAAHRENLEKEVKWKTRDLEETNQVLQRTLEDIRTMQSYLLQSEKMTSLGTMTMGMAHEFNNALNQIKGGYHIFKRKVIETAREDDEDVVAFEEVMTMFAEGVGRIEKIVKAMQLFAQVGTSDFQETDFNDLLDKALVILGPKFDNSVQLRRNMESPLILRLQQANMLQVILQLLDNALYAAQFGHSDEKFIEISSNSTMDRVEISFVNSGQPIPSDSLREIFDPFFTTKDPGVGTGLGLSVCYSIIMAHGGEIEAENLDHTVRFRVVLPLAKTANKVIDTSFAVSGSA